MPVPPVESVFGAAKVVFVPSGFITSTVKPVQPSTAVCSAVSAPTWSSTDCPTPAGFGTAPRKG